MTIDELLAMPIGSIASLYTPDGIHSGGLTRVPGGWAYQDAQSMCFVPEPPAQPMTEFAMAVRDLTEEVAALHLGLLALEPAPDTKRLIAERDELRSQVEAQRGLLMECAIRGNDK